MSGYFEKTDWKFLLFSFTATRLYFISNTLAFLAYSRISFVFSFSTLRSGRARFSNSPFCTTPSNSAIFYVIAILALTDP